jgi:hypothetical protein
MKILLIKPMPYYWQNDECLTLNNWYEGNLTPTIYDPNTYLPVSPSYIVICNDGKLRKFDSELFITQEELRNKKLAELGI